MKNSNNKSEKREIRSNVNKGVTKEGDKKAGVIQTILNLIQKKEQTKATLLKALIRTFPERDKDAMEKTIKAQLSGNNRPTRMERERGVEFKVESRNDSKGNPQTYYS